MRPLDVPVAALRDAARHSVERNGLRAVSRDVGMTAPGLQAFLDGGTPQQRTVAKLREWYVREAVRSASVSEEAARAAIVLLVDAVPERSREEAVRIVLDAVTEAHRKAGAEVPKWVAKLRK